MGYTDMRLFLLDYIPSHFYIYLTTWWGLHMITSPPIKCPTQVQKNGNFFVARRTLEGQLRRFCVE
jgi:hypothetical protein